MAFQFVHVSTYSIKSGGAGIAAEAGRKPDHSRHVDAPQPPVLLRGSEPEAAWAEIERRHAAARVTVKTKKGQVQRRLRKDENVLLAAVASYPVPTGQLDPADPDFQRWQKRTLGHFRKAHGEPLSAVLHLDESHPHIHFLTSPDLEAGQRMADIHPGERAKRDAGGRDGKRIEKNTAYKEAMRQYQDQFYNLVSRHHGHARLGPQRQRLTRAEWKAQEAQGQRFAKQIEEITSARKNLVESRQKVRAGQENLQKAERQVDRSMKNVTKQKIAVEQLQKQLDQRQRQIAARERRITGVWGGLVSFVTLGRGGVKKRIEEAQGAARDAAKLDIEKAQQKAQKAERVMKKRTQKLAQERNGLKHEKEILKDKLVDAQGAQQRAEKNFRSMKETHQPLQLENATLAKDLRITQAFISDLEKAVKAGNIDEVIDRLTKKPEPIPEPRRSRTFDAPGL